MNITVTVPQITEDGQEDGYTVTVDRQECINAACSKLGAAHVGRSYYYKADETGEVYKLTGMELAQYGAGLLDSRGVDYSLWCSGSGKLIRRPSKAVRSALGIV